jgi:hypothetical protein
MGQMKKRDQSVGDFKRGVAPILMLSSEDSVSGLNLTEASHVVIFHPFLVDGEGKIADDNEFNADTKMALSYEKQGIARSWCMGQTKQVEVVCGFD